VLEGALVLTVEGTTVELQAGDMPARQRVRAARSPARVTNPSAPPAPGPSNRAPRPTPRRQRLRALRQARNLSLKAVAAATGLSIGYLSQVERG
jgi:hypothetical protein